jgi:hypothetical protein
MPRAQAVFDKLSQDMQSPNNKLPSCKERNACPTIWKLASFATAVSFNTSHHAIYPMWVVAVACFSLLSLCACLPRLQHSNTATLPIQCTTQLRLALPLAASIYCNVVVLLCCNRGKRAQTLNRLKQQQQRPTRDRWHGDLYVIDNSYIATMYYLAPASAPSRCFNLLQFCCVAVLQSWQACTDT